MCPYVLCSGVGTTPPNYEHAVGTRRPVQNKEINKERKKEIKKEAIEFLTFSKMQNSMFIAQENSQYLG